MAAQIVSPIFTNDDKVFLRLACIHKREATDVFKFVFKYDTKDRPQHVPLLEYYMSKGISGFNRKLSREQKNLIATDPNGATFDITLLYYCLRNGSCHLAPKDDDKWISKDGRSIESLIGIVKEKRNKLAHEQPLFTNRQLLDEAQELKDALIEIIKWCGKLYSLPSTVTDPKIDELEANVKKYLYDDFEPITFEEYKKELFFEAQSEYINREGVKNLQEQYEKQHEDRVSTVNHLVDINLSLDNIYTEMKLKGNSASGQEQPIMFEEVLSDSCQSKTDDIVVISGVAGVGKTTFTKKVLHDWMRRQSEMEYLTDQNILLKTECRNKALRNFDGLLHNLMSKVSKHFKATDLAKVILHQNVLVIVDGLDELNKNSAELFEELLELKKSHNISLLITTRPEKLTFLEHKIKSYQLSIKHIQLVGVPMEKRTELVTKYYNEIAKSVPGIKDIGGLLFYLEKTSFRLEDLWKLPYNLTLITLLWAYNYMNVDDINTAPELYREISRLCKTKIMERLSCSEISHHLPVSRLRTNLDIFLKCLARESLIGLKDNYINLSQEAYERLEEVCNYINIPVEEMASGFLQRVPGTEDIYGFPHKGLQDYFAALYIWMKITKKSEGIETQKVKNEIAAALNKNHIDIDVAQNILKFAKKELETQPLSVGFFSQVRSFFRLHHKTSSSISDILQEMHESREYDISKFQNMFIYLIGLFYLESDIVQDNIKLEALKLLQRSGVHDKEHWVTVLNSVKCDVYVASFISKQPNILDGNINITDSSASAYVSLMQALKQPLENAYRVQVDIEIRGELNDPARKLFQLINFHQFRVRSILVNDKNFHAYMVMLEELKRPFVVPGKIKAKVFVNENLQSCVKILTLIKKWGITLSVLRFRDLYINDSNFHDVIYTMKSLSLIPEDGNLTGIILDIEGTLFDAHELQDLFVSYHFKVKKWLVTENNCEEYTQMLKDIELHLRDTHDIAMEIRIHKEITDLKDFLEKVKKMDINVAVLEIPEVHINDLNFHDIISTMKNLPSISKDGNHTEINLDIEGDLPDVDALQDLITNYHFKVKRFCVTENNHEKYTQMLKNMRTPFKDSHSVVMDVMVDKDISYLTDFLEEVKKKNIAIAVLKISDIYLNDSNFYDIISTIDNLPSIEKARNLTEINIDIHGDLSNFDKLRDLLVNYRFGVKRFLITENNYEKYTKMLKNLKLLLKKTHVVSPMEIRINKCITDLKDFLEGIKQKNIIVAVLKLKDICINDSNYRDIISAMKHLPAIDKAGNLTAVNLDIKGDVFEISELQDFLTSYHFKIKRFLITENNYSKYTAMFNDLKVSFRGKHFVMKIVIDRDISTLTDFLNEIKVNGISVAVLKVRDIYVNDSNCYGVMNTLKHLPCIRKDGNITAINLDIEGNLFHADELQRIMTKYHFRIKRFLVTENNYEKYTQMLHDHKRPLKNTESISMEIMIDRDIRDLGEFLQEVKEKCLCVKKFKTKSLNVRDRNVEEYFDVLRLMQPQWCAANTTAVYMLLYDKIQHLKRILTLIVELGFKLEKININDRNVECYTHVLRSLRSPIKYTQEVIANINVSSYLLEIYELLRQMKYKEFQIGKLFLKTDKIYINDINASEYAKALKLLPPCVNYHDYIVELDFAKESSVIGTILKEVIKHQFSVRIHLWDGFKRPMSYFSTSVDDLRIALKRCRVKSYAGFISPELTIPSSVEGLWAGIPNAESYRKFKTFLASEDRSEHMFLHINMSLSIDMEVIDPLVSDLRNPVSISFPEIDTDCDISRASEIAKRLAPASGKWRGTFQALRIIRSQLQLDGILKLLESLRGVTISNFIYLPASCQPSRSAEHSMVQVLAKVLLGCKNGIKWSLI